MKEAVTEIKSSKEKGTLTGKERSVSHERDTEQKSNDELLTPWSSENKAELQRELLAILVEETQAYTLILTVNITYILAHFSNSIGQGVPQILAVPFSEF